MLPIPELEFKRLGLASQWEIAELHGLLKKPRTQEKVPGRYKQTFCCHAAQVGSRVFCWSTKPSLKSTALKSTAKKEKEKKEKKLMLEISETVPIQAALEEYIDRSVYVEPKVKPTKTNHLPKYIRYLGRGFKVVIQQVNIGNFPTVEDAVVARDLFLNKQAQR